MNSTARLAQHLIRTAMELHALRLWEEWDDEDVVAFEIPGNDEPLAACIMGQAGEEFGLALFREGLAGIDRYFSGGATQHELATADQISLMVSPLYEVPLPLRGLLEEARWRGRRDALAPHMMVTRPGKHPRGARKAEIRTMLFAASAIVAAHAAGDLFLGWCRAPEGVQLLRLSGAPHKPRYELDKIVYEPTSQPIGEVEVPRELAPGDYRVLDAVWNVGLMTMNAGIKGDDRTVSVLMVADGENARVVHHDVVMGHDLERAAVSLLGFIELDRVLPREMLVLNRGFAELIEPALSAHRVACRHEPDQPLLAEIAQSMSQSFGFEEDDSGAGPSDDDHENHHRLVQAMEEIATRQRISPDRAVARYFGSVERADELIEASEDPDLWLVPFSIWRFVHYRAQSNSKTILERTLARRDLAPAVRAVGEAMRDANPSIYRIEQLDPPFVDLFDLVTGAKVRVRDWTLSQTGREGVVVPAIVFHADGFESVSMIGPALPPLWGGRVFDILESMGIEITPQGLARNSHFGGRLAERAERAPRFMPKLQNSEGHALLMHVGDFVAANPRAAAKALEANSAFDYDENRGKYVWLREGKGFGRGDLVLGSVDSIGDNLVLECNSAERFEEGRALLESIPGVRFESVRAQEFNPFEASDATPADDLPGIKEHHGERAGERGRLDQKNLPPEFVEELAKHLTTHQLDWIDSKIPMFGGKTPRELCATPEGRKRVRLEIHSMPAPHPSLAGKHMDRIRKRMFRELGLD